MIYQIRDWDTHFENFKSRTVDKCGYVCVPNKQSGMGFTRILHEKDGMAIYGVWQCLVGACSKQHIPRKGWFTDDGTPAGMAWTTEDLAVKFHREEKEIARAMEVLCSPKVGWIVAHEEKNGELLELPAVAVAVSAEPAVKTARAAALEKVEIPAALNTPEFKKVWVDWHEHLRQKKKDPTNEAQKRQLAKCLKWGLTTAINNINHAIEHNWQGLFEPNENRNGNSSGGNFGANSRPTGADIRRGPPSGTDVVAIVAARTAARLAEYAAAEKAAQDRVAAQVAGA